MTRYLALLLILFFVHVLPAQKKAKPLSSGEAIIRAIDNNYSIILNNYQVDLAKNDLDYAIYAFFPSLNASASGSRSVGNLSQTLRDTVINRDNAQSSNVNLGVNAQWNIFDGLGRIAQLDQTKVVKNLRELSAMQVVQNVAADILSSYFQLVYQLDQMEVLQKSLEFSQQRMDIAKSRYDIGRASKLDYLTAQVDYNADLSALKNLKAQYQQNLFNFNFLVTGQADTSFIPGDSIYLQDKIALPQIVEQLRYENPAYQSALLSVEQARLQQNVIRSDFLPDVNLNANYSYSQSQSEGFLRQTVNSGFGYGFSVAIPIFNQLNTVRRYQAAKISIESAEVNQEFTLEQLLSTVKQTFVRYSNTREIMDLEKENIGVAEENAAIALERYRLGKSNALELREAQLQLLEADNRRLEATFQTKLAEIELVRLSGAITENYQ